MKPNKLTRRSLAGPSTAIQTAAATGSDDATSAHMRNWMECVRSRKTPNAGIETGYSHSIAVCMTVAAMQTERRVTFDDVAQEVVVA